MKKISRVWRLLFILMMCMLYRPLDIHAEQISQKIPQGYTAIRTVEDLDAVRNNLSGKYILMNDIDLGETTVKGGEYDIDGYGWKPIDEFSGTLDGNGYRIKGMHIYGKLPRTIQGGGLFGSTSSDAIIKNLGVVDVDIDVICADDSVKKYGALAGKNSGRIENCFTTGKIRFEAESNTIVAVGGIVGCESATYSIVSNCYNACEIEQVGTGTNITLHVGGIEADATKAEYCYNVGVLNIVKTDTTEYGAVIATGNLTNCYYLNTTADQGHAGGDDNSCVKVSKTQLKSKVYMNKWLQTGTWYIDPYCSFKYPQLIACAQVRLEKMSWVAKPEQTEYEVGDELNLDGAEIELVYDDGVKNVVPITEDMVSGYDKNIVGTQTITVAYMSKKVTYEVKVKEVEATSITIESDADSVNLGDCLQLKANILPQKTTNKNVTWTSSNEAVATVDANGVVRGKSVGTVVVTVEASNGLQDTKKINVIVECEDLELSKSQIQMKVGEKTTLKAYVEPTNATTTISWKVVDTKIADVIDGIIYAKSVGITNVIARTDNGIEARCSVTVQPDVVEVKSISVDRDVSSMKVGEKLQLEATVLPSDATNKSVAWTSSNEAVATVDANGVVCGKSVGTVTISARSSNGLIASCKVIVQTQQIFEQPNSSQANSSQNEEVVEVYPGKVKIKSAKNIKGGKVKLTYNHTGTAVKYEIKYSTSKKFTKCKTKYRYSSKNYTLKGLKKSRKYYIKVRAYNKINGKYYKGKWSAVKVVKVKK